jgi:hypothetical protein
MFEVIYVRGGKGCESEEKEDLTPEEHVWQYAHPRIKRSNTKLTLFDFAEGKFKQWFNWGGEQPPQKNGRRMSPTNEFSMLDNSEKCASVLALYSYIRSIGDIAPGSLVELHFFTHGWREGPILIDTDQSDQYEGNQKQRDPKDKDPRNKDFDIPDVLSGKNGIRFRKAFSSKALVKLWGCSYEQDHRDQVINFYQIKNDKEKKRILDAYLLAIQDTYQFKLHKAIGIPVYAAPLGWGTNPYLPFGIQGKTAAEMADAKLEGDKPKYRGIWPPHKGDRWWRVSSFFHPDKGYEFYQKVLGASMDLLDYVAYTDSIIRRLAEK